MEQAIYFFKPSLENITKFESIQADVNMQVGYSFTNQSVKIGDTNILTNFTSPISPFERQKAIVQCMYYCTIFEFNQDSHNFMMTFEEVHYFDNQQEAENFVNGIVITQ
jgi:hypothetical protein